MQTLHMGAPSLKQAGRSSSRLIGVLGLVVTLAGCAKIKTDEKFTGLACGSSDQYASYMNPMDSTQIQTISIDSAFSSTEIAKIEAAVATWNAESRRSMGHDIFRTQIIGVSSFSVPQTTQDCGFPGAQGAFSVVRVTSTQTWTALGFDSSNPGVTLRCASGVDFVEKQIVLINPANLTNAAQLFENVVLHELGHAIGLDHSCDKSNAGKPGFVGCDSQSVDPSYLDAVMNPIVNPANPKNDLRRNDEERSTCALSYRP